MAQVKEINIDNVIQILSGIVKGKEDYIDPRSVRDDRCQYAPAGNYPGCLVGQVYRSLGANISQLEVMDDSGTVEDVVELGNFPVDTTHAAAMVMMDAQRIQDGGRTWGEAMVAAVEEAQRIRATHNV